MSKADPAVLLAQVERSPAAVAVHDKFAWMSIFAQYHVVEDPVGSTPHVGGIYDGKSGKRGHEALGRFFDTFIAPNNIRFDVVRDIVNGNHVVRDLTIHIAMSEKVHVSVPMHLLYELGLENNEWKIIRLAAHWELMPMMAQLFSKGLAAVPVMSALTVRMIALQGIGGMLGFSKAAINIGNKGKAAVKQFAAALNQKSLSDLMAVCDNDADIVHWPYGGAPCYPSELFDQVSGQLRISDKILAAGDVITASIEWLNGESCKAGLLIAEFNRKTGKIRQLRTYY